MPEPTEVGGGGVSKGRKSMEFDLDSSWPLDQISFISSYHKSPFPISSPNEQPCSPLWAFSDDDRLLVADGGGQASSAFDGGLRLSDYPIPLTCRSRNFILFLTSVLCARMNEDYLMLKLHSLNE